MYKTLISLFTTIIISLNCLSAQYGIRLKYASQSGEILEFGSDVLQEDANLFNKSYEVGIDYWIKPFDKRIEFVPEVAYSLSTNSINEDQFNQNGISLILNTRVYPMDIGSDCDCPTFSKQGNFVTKGFYFELSPGALYNTINLETSSFPQERVSEKFNQRDFTYRLGVGAGLDIGVSNFLTINPFITYNIIGNYNLLNPISMAAPNIDFVNIEKDIRQLLLGVRLSFRPNYDPFKR